ncbi:vacuole protein [Leucosporidium creatinivorum]|uniref:Vacuole protein n=1 Tax=Leucosporidium creatinivorum TaxID=106004 RepID=A0A1Y2F3P1_9BASI|nr:vacuole protein [Leucosporidium creatinivorum]
MSEKLPLTHPSPSPSPPPRSTRSRLLPLLLLLLPALYLTTTTYPLTSLLPHPTSQPLRADKGASCPLQVEPLNVGKDWRPEEDNKYVEKAVERLRGAVRIPTESYDNMNPDPSKEPRFEILTKLHDYLEETFPLLHNKLDLEKVSTYGLLYTWPGSSPSLKPLVLMAHQDVVPVNKDTLDRWTYPPFEAHLDQEGWVWGRGSADCKNTLVGILAAIEKLVEEGWEPTRTIIVSSGFDEEIGGRRSALPLSDTLLTRYGQNGISLILDEGFTGVDVAYNRTFARLGMAEKGAVSVTIEVLTEGGHSSVPPRHTGIGILSLLLVELEKNPDTPKLRRGNPMLCYLNCAADFGEVEEGLKRRIRSEKEWQGLGEELAEGDPILRAFLGTTQAVDLVQGGIKVNALPEYATATSNYRIDFLSSVHSTLSRLSSILSPVVHSLNMTFDSYGSHANVSNNVVRLKMVKDSGIEPAPITPSEGKAWEFMSGSVRGVWRDAVVAPSAMIANTDTKWTWNLTTNIYRFVPGSLELIKNFHTVDERIHTDAHISGIRFFHTLLRNTKGWTAD